MKYNVFYCYLHTDKSLFFLSVILYIYIYSLNTYSIHISLSHPHFSVELGFFSFQPRTKLDKTHYFVVATSYLPKITS